MSKTKRTQAEWSELLTKLRASGQGVKKWCSANGINVNSMYNQITKYHKKEIQSDDMRVTKPIDTKNKNYTKGTTNAEKPVTVEWKELKAFTEQGNDANERGSVYVEIGGIHLAANVGYPVTHLAALCKELIRTC